MSPSLDYRHTVRASMIACACQAIVVMFAPLLFLTFHETYGISLAQIGWLVTLNFCTQLAVDFLCARFASRVRYRPAILWAHALCAAGLVAQGVLPDLCPAPYLGLCAAVMLYSVGAGLLEVVVSPIVEACPTDGKAAYMSLLHSFYCWGCVGVIVLSNLLFRMVGLAHWRLISMLWALVPALNFLYLRMVPINQLVPEGQSMGFGALFRNKLFWCAMLLMICAGAAEQAIEQWSSAYTEAALGLSKRYCDLVGPCVFAVLMGLARVFHGHHAERLNLRRYMGGSAVLTLAGYLLCGVAQAPFAGLLGCALCGLGVGVMWPGVLSLAAEGCPRGGTAMFALLALAGDVGCSSGPTLVGCLATACGDDLRRALLFAALFPALLLLVLWRLPAKPAINSQSGT